MIVNTLFVAMILFFKFRFQTILFF